ncbi:MAG TPA: DMT family transporter [Ktedonobacterales bacterium]|nr:DMT family transporter [Ktedonobacterales bacterium]
MPLSALGLLLLAAVLHALWNLLVKRAGEKQIFTWWALAVGVVCFSPLVVFGTALPGRAWPYILGSAAMEAVYFIALTLAYKLGDFSLVYPLARGMAPALLAVWAALFLGERPTPLGLVGLGILLVGLLVVGSGAWWSQRKVAAVSKLALGATLLVAFSISVYTVIDGAAVRFTDPSPYTVVVLGLSAVFTAPAVLARYGQKAMLAEWRANWPRILLVGVLMMLTFVLVLHAYTLAQVNYAGAIREVSVVFGALAGWLWLNEGFGVQRAIGAALIFAGILVIAVAG